MRLALLALFALVSAGLGARERAGLSVGYYGETLFHPGAIVELEFHPRTASGLRFSLTPSIRAYEHARNHTGVALVLRAAIRHRFDSGLVVELGIGSGVLLKRTSGGPVYSYDAEGVLVERDSSSRFAWLNELVPGVGCITEDGYGFLFRPSANWEYPFNGYFLPHLSAEIVFTAPIGSQGGSR